MKKPLLIISFLLIATSLFSQTVWNKVWTMEQVPFMLEDWGSEMSIVKAGFDTDEDGLANYAVGAEVGTIGSDTGALLRYQIWDCKDSKAVSNTSRRTAFGSRDPYRQPSDTATPPTHLSGVRFTVCTVTACSLHRTSRRRSGPTRCTGRITRHSRPGASPPSRSLLQSST